MPADPGLPGLLVHHPAEGRLLAAPGAAPRHLQPVLDFDGFRESSFLHIDNDLEFADSSLVKTAWNVTGEG